MAGPSTSADVAAELATRPGHRNLRSSLVRWLLITISLTFLGALGAAGGRVRHGLGKRLAGVFFQLR
jgi:hypothetical protein